MNSKYEKIIKLNSACKLRELITWLIDHGYERVGQLSKEGEFLSSGGNLSIFLINNYNPVTLEFFGDNIDSIFEYNLNDNLILKRLSEIKVKSNILFLDDGSRIKPGDYVVHEDHGIGIFQGYGLKEVELKENEYIFIEYLNNDILFLPEELKIKLSPYIGVGRKRPKLSKLGSVTWKKTYKKTYENVILLAKELLNIYARRELAQAKKWKIFNDWEEEVRGTFGYSETEDQKIAIESIYSDLKSSKPVDRLVCGDVGFGKTEVAIRAVAQAIPNGFQTALLVPTTILAEQHYVMLKKRFANLPVVIEHISRFVKQGEQERIIEDLKNGRIDIIVGTHRLFGEDVKFKNLGLLVIDEEQKFGVKDKEKLKKIRSNLNVLSLTATPIPRTLFMALSGIRDISQITSSPVGRMEIDTKVEKYDEVLIREYINREMERKGQAYYLHDEVRTIIGRKNQLKRLFPKLLIEVAHGQMKEDELAKTMSEFADGKIDILVCSTIIENGLDLANANTLIADDSDKFGLSQLYQIRGRIGRSNKQAYALFTYKDKTITQNAFKRLKAIVENTELGSGYNISLSDLEIRGGGNILGKEQHGNMEAVGLILYSKLLNKAVENLRK